MSAHLDDSHNEFSGPILDLERHHFDRMSGPIRVIGTWLLHTGEQCLVLLPALVSPHAGKVIPCVIRQSEAFLWAPEIGDPAYCARRVLDMAPALHMQPFSKRDHITIHSVIEDNLRDLIMMPPPPESDRVVVADGITTDSETGKIITQGEILSNV